jgi:hypothetical protein
MKPHRKRHPLPLWKKLLVGLGVVTVLIIIVIVVAPPVLSILARNALLEAGAEKVELGDVNFNPFTGRLELHQLEVRAQGKRVISLDYGHIDIEVPALLRKKMEIVDIELDQGFLYILQGDKDIGIKGLDFASDQTTSPQADEDTQWHFGIDEARIQNTSVRFEGPKFTTFAGFDELTLATLYSWERDRLSHLIARGTIADGSFDIDIQMTPLASIPEYSGSALINSLALDRIQPLLQDQLSKLSGLLQLRAEFEIAEKSRGLWSIQLDSMLESTNFAVGMDDLIIESDRFRYEGKPNVKLKLVDQDDVEITVKGQGSLAISQTMIQSAGYRITSKQLDWSGNKALSLQPNSDLQLEITGEAVINSLELSDENGLQVAGLNDISAEGLEFRMPAALKTRSLKLGRGSLLKKPDPKSSPIAAWQTMVLNQLALDDKRLDLNHADINQLSIQLDIDREDKLVLPLPESRLSTSPEKKQAKTEAAPPYQIRIDQLNLSKNSQIDFTDASLKPTYRGQLILDKAQITNIDSSRPDQASLIQISGLLNRYAPVRVNGEVKPFKDTPDVNLEASIHSIDLPRLNPYSRDYAGYDIKTGSMDIDSKLKIVDSQINDRIRLTLHKIAIEVSDQEKAAKTDAALTIGLPAALSMMKDSKGNVKLDLPIEGDLNDPQFNFAPAIRSALGKALTQASSAYLVYAIQPYGVALLVTKMAGKMVTRVNFDPLVFEPGSTAPPEALYDYLEKISTVMKNRPALELRVCGIATQEELNKLSKTANPDEALTELASSRAFAIKDLLIEKYGIEEKRLLGCRPEIDEKPEASPRVEISM